MEKASKILLIVFSMMIFLSGVVVGNITSHNVKTVTRVVEFRETYYQTVTETVKPPLVVVADIYMVTSCIYNASSPEEDQNCTRNVKAVSLIVKLKNVGESTAKICPERIFLSGYGVEPAPDFTNPEEIIILKPKSPTVEVLAVYRVRDPEGMILFHNMVGHEAIIQYMDEEENTVGEIVEKPRLTMGSWWVGGR